MPARVGKRIRASKRKTASRKPARGQVTGAEAMVACWEDDPGDLKLQPPLVPITAPAPNASAAPLPYSLGGAAPAPQVYQPGTRGFRYYAASCALRRTASFWGSVLPPQTTWQVGNRLPVILDDGVDLNAFYTRGGFGDAAGLHSFHDSVSGRTVYSCESPDVASHEMGHAVLDAIRPQLWNAQTIEAAAFHESFGDITALLSALQVPSLRLAVVNETGGMLNRASRLSRMAEQLGAAIRIHHPDAVDRDCLRNATNTFFYRDPQTLPPAAPASQLSSEPHSFSRVFTAAFFDALAGIFKLQEKGTADDLAKAAVDAGRILAGGTVDAPVVPDYFSQVAAHMIRAGEGAPFNGKYREALKSAFVRRGILSLQAAATITSVRVKGSRRGAEARARRPVRRELQKATISGAPYGLNRPALKVYTAEEPKELAVTSSSLMLGPTEPRSPQNAAESFTEDLFQRGRVEIGPYASAAASTSCGLARKTHIIVEESGDLVLKRKIFDCGFA